MNQLLHRLYGLTPLDTEKSAVGAGSDTYFESAPQAPKRIKQ